MNNLQPFFIYIVDRIYSRIPHRINMIFIAQLAVVVLVPKSRFSIERA